MNSPIVIIEDNPDFFENKQIGVRVKFDAIAEVRFELPRENKTLDELRAAAIAQAKNVLKYIIASNS